MHLGAYESCHSLVVLCILLRSCQAFKNDATELLFSHVSAPVPEVQSNMTLNRARNGGREAGGAAHERGGEWRSLLLAGLQGCGQCFGYDETVRGGLLCMFSVCPAWVKVTYLCLHDVKQYSLGPVNTWENQNDPTNASMYISFYFITYTQFSTFYFNFFFTESFW